MPSAQDDIPLYLRRIIFIKFVHTPLLIVETFSVDNRCVRFCQQRAVENIVFLHIGLWTKIRCSPKRKPTFPHKFSLILLLLP